MAFTRNRPTASELLQNSQSLIFNNFNDSDTSFGVDHYAFSDTTANNGHHKIVAQLAETASGSGVNRTRSGVGAATANFPAATANVNKTFVANYTPDTFGGTPDTQLFTTTGTGIVSQLTGFLSGEDGWQWVGGILIQWGSVSTAATSGTVTFKDRVGGAIPFPNNLYNVITTPKGSLLGQNRAGTYRINTTDATTFDKTLFKWNLVTNSTVQYSGFFWVAIGN